MTPTTLNLRIAGASLRHAWRQNVLALGGLAIGVGAIVAMLALTLIVRREALRQFDRTGLDVLAIRKVSGGDRSPDRPSSRGGATRTRAGGPRDAAARQPQF